MSFDALLIHTVTVRRMTPGAEDRYGDTPLEHDAALDVTTAARVEPAVGSESVSNREAEASRYTVFLPPDVVIAGIDELEWLDEGITLKVDGPPMVEHDAIGAHHVELNAFRVTGA